MPVDNDKDLFVYELGILRDIETSSIRMLDLVSQRVSREDLGEVIRSEQRQCTCRQDRLDSCLQSLEAPSMQAPSETVDAVYLRFKRFVAGGATHEMVDQFAVDTLVRLLYLGIAALRPLIGWTVLSGQHECSRTLHSNLVEKQESAARLERLAFELRMRRLAHQAA
ncbi:DUF892 family protein [Rhizomonospora bruguierae]|uniref:DUF892 family protein n=1 Tax=Rhizomonospora bruguierae TaxID=1581705 RepID=UPI001BCC65F9|nr:DUF892 family protein [Micromonospora sp. NBRC 107566]